ncbi:hypothetical protein D3C77_237540 [compost metagenome]
MGGNRPVADVAPAVNASEYSTPRNASSLNPIEIGLHWAELAERWRLVFTPNVLPIPFSRSQVEPDTDVALGMSIFNRQSGQLIPAETPPKADSEQGNIPGRLQ